MLGAYHPQPGKYRLHPDYTDDQQGNHPHNG